MDHLTYHIVPYQGAWGVDRDGSIAGPYVSKEAALEAAMGPIMNEVKLGHQISVLVPGSDGSEATTGARDQ